MKAPNAQKAGNVQKEKGKTTFKKIIKITQSTNAYLEFLSVHPCGPKCGLQNPIQLSPDINPNLTTIKNFCNTWAHGFNITMANIRRLDHSNAT